ncbi:hypothetical protein HPB49_009853 [Dermacentor silvarum]|uniref:Uncharacterized protein n=1 Tax=Dermacentor silvarum TaxID=543639 RepID=A0ACB8C8N2_DERSI|nr:hypothetical protein HPB49_009853 [Dermacentor silvarum]
MNSFMFYGLRKAREKTTACDIPSGSEDSDLSDSADEIQFKRLSAGSPPPKSFEILIPPAEQSSATDTWAEPTGWTHCLDFTAHISGRINGTSDI